MAVSPLIPRSPSAGTTSNTVASKARSLAAGFTFKQEKVESPSAPQQEGELAEQLNEDVRRKYVKGTVHA